MKNFLLIVFLGFQLFAHAQGFWTELAPIPSDDNATAPMVSAPNVQTVWTTSTTLNDNAYTHYWHKSVDGGTTWTMGEIATGTSLGISALCAVSASKAFVAMHSPFLTTAGGIWMTDDAGATWTQIPDLYQTVGASFPNDIHFYDELNGTIMGDPENGFFEIYNTTDGGNIWTRVPEANIPATIGNTEFGYIHKARANGYAIWFQSNMGRIFSSVDLGNNWTVADTPLMDFGGLNYFEFDFKNQTDGILVSYDYNLYRSEDGSATWQLYFPPTDTALRNGLLWNIPGSGDSYFMSGDDLNTGVRGSSYSLDDGVNWIDMNVIDTNPIVPVNAQFLDEDNAYTIGYYASEPNAAANYKIFKHGPDNATISALLGEQTFYSTQAISVYPNPVVDQVSISAGKIKSAIVYDITGKTIFSKEFPELDVIVIPMANFEPGVYIAKISTSNQGSQQIKLVKQ